MAFGRLKSMKRAQTITIFTLFADNSRLNFMNFIRIGLNYNNIIRDCVFP